MKRNRLLVAMLVVAILTTTLGSGLSVVSFAAPDIIEHTDTDVGWSFNDPHVHRVLVDYNYPPLWPGSGAGDVYPVNPRPFSTDARFNAPRGIPGITWSATPPHLLDAVSPGWVYTGSQLGSITRQSRNAAAAPWQVGEPITPAYMGWPQNPNITLAAERGVFDFRGWNRVAGGGAGTVMTATTPITADTTLFAQWVPQREIRIRHSFEGGPAASASRFNSHELPPSGSLLRDVGTEFNLGNYATNLHLTFDGFNFYIFRGWRVAVGTSDNVQAGHISGFNPSVFNQSFVIPAPYDFSSFAIGRLYLIADWEVIPPDTSVWVPPTQPEGGGGGGGAGSGQQTNPPGTGTPGVPGAPGVTGPGVGPGPGGEPPADEIIPEETEVPETGGAPLLPVFTPSLPVIPVPPAVVPMPGLPAPFTPAPSGPSIVEIPAIAVPLIGLDSNSWALMNLILAVIGAIGAAAVVVHVWLRKKEKAGEAGIDWEDGEEGQKRRRQWLMIVGLVSLVSLVLFPLTQDMSLRMTLVDVWTMAHVVLLVAQGLATWQVVGKDRREERVAR